MSKPAASADPFERKHRRLLTAVEQRILAAFTKLYNGTADALEGIALDGIDPDTFALSQRPDLAARIDTLTAQVRREITAALSAAVESSYNLSTDKAQDLIARYAGADTTAASYAEALHRADGAASFARQWMETRSVSSAVWRITDGFKTEMEDKIARGLIEGKSADVISREVRNFLNEPNKLFRRVRAADGTLHLSKAAKAYHPGRGVYRSSYKNARRLAVTETNNAYRKADSDSWQQLDFVIGVRVQLSNNHTYTNSKGQKLRLVDICDDLAGDYPKDFVFTSWHPHCRCIATPILKSRKEMARDRERIRAGEAPRPSAREVTELPPAFRKWETANADRLAQAARRGTLPHWLTDNYLVNEDGTLFPLFGYPSHGAKLKAFEKKAKELLRGKVFRDGITISGKGIREWLNQPFKHKADKDKALFHIDRILKDAVYIGEEKDIHEKKATARIYETKVFGERSFLVVRSFNWGKQLHSISDQEGILKHIKMGTPTE